MKVKKALNTHQFNKIVLINMFALKLIGFSGFMYSKVQNDIWIIVLSLMSIDLLFLFLLLKAKSKTKLPFIECLNKTIGKILTKFILFICILFFLFKLLFILSETYFFLNYILYDELNQYLLIACFVIIWTYLSYGGLTNIGRTIEVFFFPVIIGLILALGVGFFQADFLNVFPILKNGILPVFETAFEYSFWFGDYIFVLFIIDKSTYNRKNIKSTLIYVTIGILIVTFIVLTFVGLFDLTGHRHYSALSEIAQVPPEFAGFNRIDWIIVLFFTIAQFFQTTIYFYCIYFINYKLFKIRHKTYNLIIVNLLILILYVYFAADNSKILLVARNIMPYITVFIMIFMTIMLLIVLFNKKHYKTINYKKLKPLLKMKKKEVYCNV